MGLFAEVFDTTRNEAEEMLAAKTILMLGTLKPEPCSLASIHAINSRFILNECREPEFYALVRDGRIRFHRRKGSGGKPESLREELINRMGNEPYFRYGWPEIVDPDSDTLSATLCNDVSRRLKGNKSVSIKNDSLNERIEHALKLLSIIERAPSFEEEARNDFRSTLLSALPDIPTDEDHAAVRQLITELATDDRIRGRSAAYKAMEVASFDSATKTLAKDVVDGCYNSAVARSLDAQFLSSRRLIELGGNFHPHRNPIKSAITYIDGDADAINDLMFFVKQPISWPLVYEAVSNFREIDPVNLDIARRRLAKSLAEKSHTTIAHKAWAHGALRTVSYIAIGSATPFLRLEGGIADWSLIAMATFILVLESKLDNVKQQLANETPKLSAPVVTKRLSGWLDRE